MIAVKPSLIRAIDAYAEETLQIKKDTLMQRAGRAVFEYVQIKLNKKNPYIVVICGGGNNGGDGYEVARLLLENGARVVAVDPFFAFQSTSEGIRAFEAYRHTPDADLSYSTLGIGWHLPDADCVIEAVFGSGARPDLPPLAEEILFLLHEEKKRRMEEGEKPLLCISIDCPLGVDAESGRAHACAFPFDGTVELSFPKIGTHSYPAARYAGEFVLNTLGLPIKRLVDNFNLQDMIMDEEIAKAMLPKRDKEGHKGSFGTLGAITGSSAYRGAALLSSLGALRGGIGLLRYFGEASVCDALLAYAPESVCSSLDPIAEMSEKKAEDFLKNAPKVSAYLLGSGCGQSEGLANLLRAFLKSEGAPLVLDADALNVLADSRYALLPLLKQSKRKVLLTPHPLEFARLIGKTAEEVQADRLTLARAFAQEYAVTLLLKGKGSITSDENGRVCINPSGNTALSKGGSGDVLAGAVASYAAQGLSLFDAAALGAYLHGRAGESLSEIYGEAGVLPSDLPKEIAKMAHLLK